MPTLVLSSALARWLPDSDAGSSRERRIELAGDTLAAILDSLFQQYPTVRGYVVDDQGTVRHHVAVFIDGESIGNKRRLDVAVGANSEVTIMQALSGG